MNEKYFVGIDIGSTAIKAALINAQGNLVGDHVRDSGSLYHKNACEALAELLRRHSVARDQVGYLIATGYGRKLFKEADDSISEITANALGAHAVGQRYGGISTIINIGGQDSKAILIDKDGNVSNFAMNDKCAAGTGRFLDVAARNLEIDLEQMGELHFAGTGAPLTINSTCTVFAESEIIGLLAGGHGKPEVIAGIHYAIAKRTARLAKRVGIDGKVYMDGGPALNRGLVAAIADELEREVVVPDAPQTTTAFGAAILARSEYLAEQAGADA